jgi:hypothetical protein
MHPHTTTPRARIQPRDVSRALLADRSTAALSLVSLERIRGYQTEAEVARLLRHNGAPPASAALPVAMLRQKLGAALVRAGHRVAGLPSTGPTLASAPSDGTLRPAS